MSDPVGQGDDLSGPTAPMSLLSVDKKVNHAKAKEPVNEAITEDEADDEDLDGHSEDMGMPASFLSVAAKVNRAKVSQSPDDVDDDDDDLNGHSGDVDVPMSDPVGQGDDLQGPTAPMSFLSVAAKVNRAKVSQSPDDVDD